MKALDRIVLAVDRRLNRKDRKVPPPVPFCGPGGYEAPKSSALGHTGAHSALTRRRRGPGLGLARFVGTVAAALAISVAAFSAGAGYAGGRVDERVAETEASYEGRIRETVEAQEARDVCLAEAEARGGGGYWAGQLAELREDPRLEECRAQESLRAAWIRAEVGERSFRSGS